MSSARAVAARAGVVEHRLVRLPDLKEAGDIAGASFAGLPQTYIPMRNAIFYSLAASYAEETGAAAMVGGHNKDDTAVFEDVGQAFFSRLEEALLSGSARLRSQKMRILRPLRQKTKAGVLELASTLGVPLELTWSCHRDGEAHCWECAGCRSRGLAFSTARMTDPLSREARKVT